MTRCAGRAGAVLAFAFAASCAVASAAPADEVPTADEIVARSKVATGIEKRPETEREVWTVRVAGLDGTFDTVRRGADTAGTTQLGPFRTARGTWRGSRWHQNENGQTIVERAEPSQTERTASQIVERVREPVDAWEIVTTYASGHLLRTFYDARTYALVRTERVSAGHTQHTTYDDFRTDARGRTRPWHYFGGDDRPDNDFDFRLARDDLDVAISDADLAIPRDRRALVEFPAGVESVKLPVRIVDGRIYVRVTIAGRGLDFLLDSGSAALIIDENVARELKLPVYGRTTQTVVGSFPTGRVVIPAVAIGALGMRDVVMHTLPYSTEAKSVRVVGLLGYDFLEDVGLKIDFAGGEIEAFRPGALVPPAGAGSLDVRLNSGTPVARATIGAATGDDFIIDTGAAFSYVLFQRFARAHPYALEAATKESLGNGVGGTFGYRTIETTTRVVLGPWSLDNVTGVEALAPNAFGFDNEDGLIGSDILKRFTVYLDYAEDRVWLAPNAHSGVDSALKVAPNASLFRVLISQ